MNATLLITAILVIIVISLLYMAIRMLYKDHITESPLYIVTDKRSMVINETDDYLRLINNERSIFLVELNGEFFVNVTAESYSRVKIGDQIIITMATGSRDFMIKKL